MGIEVKGMKINDQKDNCLTVIRLLAAFQVMYDHMIYHLEIPANPIIGTILSVFQGVPIFFGLSGFFIWFSIQKSVNYRGYLRKRFFRIYPELWAAVIIEILVMLVFYRKTTLKDVGLFLFTQSTVLQFWTPDSLREYGCGTPNGSLWTICVLIQFYIIAWLLYEFLKEKSMALWGGIIIGFVVLSESIERVLIHLGIDVIRKLYDQTVIRYLWIFLMGMFLANFYSQLIRNLKKIWFICLIGAAAIKVTDFDFFVHYGVFYTMLLLTALIGFGYKYQRFQMKHDISYGIYIYHMTIVNAFIMLGLVHKLEYMIYAMLITFALAYLSNATIGAASMKMKLKQ